MKIRKRYNYDFDPLPISYFVIKVYKMYKNTVNRSQSHLVFITPTTSILLQIIILIKLGAIISNLKFYITYRLHKILIKRYILTYIEQIIFI